jgi:hypothetical protein
MCVECLPRFDLSVASYGNVLAATAFLHGLGQDDLARAELDDHQVEYSLIHSARVARPVATEGSSIGPPVDRGTE